MDLNEVPTKRPGRVPGLREMGRQGAKEKHRTLKLDQEISGMGCVKDSNLSRKG